MITDDQKALIVKLYASGESTVRIARRLGFPLLQSTTGCIAAALLFEDPARPRYGARFAKMHSMSLLQRPPTGLGSCSQMAQSASADNREGLVFAFLSATKTIS